MDLSTLGPEEQLALVALVTVCVSADGEVSEGESAELDALVTALGGEHYRQLAEEADQRFPEEADLRAFLTTITRPEARETIYGILLDATTGDAMRGRDLEILDWLRETWSLHVKVVGEGNDPS